MRPQHTHTDCRDEVLRVLESTPAIVFMGAISVASTLTFVLQLEGTLPDTRETTGGVALYGFDLTVLIIFACELFARATLFRLVNMRLVWCHAMCRFVSR